MAQKLWKTWILEALTLFKSKITKKKKLNFRIKSIHVKGLVEGSVFVQDKSSSTQSIPKQLSYMATAGVHLLLENFNLSIFFKKAENYSIMCSLDRILSESQASYFLKNIWNFRATTYIFHVFYFVFREKKIHFGI